MGRPITHIEASEEELNELRRRARGTAVSVRDQLRAKVILLRIEGLSVYEVAEKLGTRPGTASKWSSRFKAQGMEGLCDGNGRGRKARLASEKLAMVMDQVAKPPAGHTRWSIRSMARAAKVSPSTVQRIWSRNEIKPHRTETFKISKDPRFEEKFWDVIGLYLDPPQKALVFCCDEKSQCQALERTQPGLPLNAGHCRTRTHDYIRHGTVTLFAALNYLDGKIISRTETSHSHVEWLRFLKQVERETPKGLAIHLIADNYATHKHPKVKAWVERRPRFHLHFTPTGSSWLNLVERFFADLTGDCIREGSFTSVAELVRSINEYLANRNLNPKRYVWRAQGAQILAKIQRAKLAAHQNG